MKYLIWDFDGTLGYREGGMWSGALLEILRQAKPEFRVTIEQVRPHLQAGFPWHTPDQPHTTITSAEQWWNALDGLFEQTFLGMGVPLNNVGALVKQVRQVYPNPQSWRLFDDVWSTLELLSATGWTHLILSNHVPELAQIIHSLRLDNSISRVFNSAETGYEKPHRQAFLNVLTTLSDVETIWMIGDSLDADILGAERVGLPGILVRRFHAQAKHYCATLDRIPAMIAR